MYPQTTQDPQPPTKTRRSKKKEAPGKEVTFQEPPDFSRILLEKSGKSQFILPNS
jgi:hypothetical protein